MQKSQCNGIDASPYEIFGVMGILLAQSESMGIKR